MMIDWREAKDAPTDSFSTKNKKMFSDNIYTFDIETTSLFNINGTWQPFIYDDSIDYKQVEKAACCYIWMFGINDVTYYGRELADFEQMLHLISSPLYTKIIYIHNLAFEFGWIEEILNKYTIEDLIALQKHKPIMFYVKELNIQFRCSYALTNMSLADASKEYTKVQKKTGDLDYNLCRSPLTELSALEKDYCEFDIICLREIIKHYRDEYGGVVKIPPTSTSTVRYAIKKIVDYFYIRKQQDLVPNTEMYLRYWWAFAGGYTHANVLISNRVITGLITSMDESSAYPFVMTTERFPVQPFRKARESEFYDSEKRDKYAFLLKVRFINMQSKYYNHYVQYEKVKSTIKNPVTDNGRVVSCDSCEYWLTDVDFDIIMTNYHVDKVVILECFKSYKDYLDIRIIKFILDLYIKKTKLKNFTSDDPEEVEHINQIYRASKALLNGIYGISVSGLIHLDVYQDHKWTIPDALNADLDINIGKTYDEMFNEYIGEQLEGCKTSFSTLFYYPCGVWVTAYARRNILMRIFSSHDFDRDVLYMDTDSLKYIGNYDKLFEDYNKTVYNKYVEMCERFPNDLTIDMFMPEDIKGIKHPIGYYELDGKYSEFKTLGSKKYCYRSIEDGKLHITVSGVSKKAAYALNDDINNFNLNMKWGYTDSGKLSVTYKTNQEPITFKDIDGNYYTTKNKYAVVLQPTSYTLGITPVYEALIEYYRRGKERVFTK